MISSYAIIFAAANSPDFQGRCLVALCIAARDIIAEAADAPDHHARLDFAVRVMRDSAKVTPRQLAMQVLINPAIAADPTNADDDLIQAQVNTVIPALIAIG
jgi:hypothetical protein